MPHSPIQLQAKSNFKYTFKNITLLYEALTHSFDNPLRILADGNIFYRKKSFYRLKTLGVSVLKLILSEQALRQNDVTAGPGQLSLTRVSFLNEDVLRSIGRKLELHNYVEVQKGYDRRAVEKQYPDVVKALVGAVFVDAGSYNILGNAALAVTQCVVHRMYENTNLFTVKWTTMPFDDCFPPTNIKNVAWFLLMKGYTQREDLYDPESLFGSIGYKFETLRYLVEALTHGSAKQYDYLKDIPDHQRLEFLGDAVYELIICEYLFWYFVNDDVGLHFNQKEIEKYTSEPFQQVLAEFICLPKYLLKPRHVKVKGLHVFLESLIGAIYVDSWHPLASTKRMLISLAKECSLELLNSGCAKLPYSIKTVCTTKYRLTQQQESSIPEDQFSSSPQIIHQYEILNVIDFTKHWQFFTVSEENHLTLLQVALTEAEDKLEKQFLPMAAANQAEYKRMNLYGVAAQKLLVIMEGQGPKKLEKLLTKIRDIKPKKGIYSYDTGELVIPEEVILEAGYRQRTEPAAPELTNENVKNSEGFQPECRLQQEENVLTEPRDDLGVSFDEAGKAVNCLWNFILGWIWLVVKWVVNRVFTLVLAILQIMLFIFLLFIFVEVAFHFQTEDDGATNRIGMQKSNIEKT